MFSVAAALGLRAAEPGGLIPCKAPFYLLFHFLFAYLVLSGRVWKNMLGIDNNVAPRESSATLGEAAVKAGKITRRQLDMVKRNEAAHANSVENYALFVGSLLTALVAGVPNVTVNYAALAYTVLRMAYAWAYIFIEHERPSQLRGVFWGLGNLCCCYLYWKAGWKLNG